MKPAFSAVELLLVAGISAILVAIAVPGYLEAKVRAEVMDVQVTLRNVQLALIVYKADNNGQYPEKRSPTSSFNPLMRLYKSDNQFLTTPPEDRFKRNLRGYGAYYYDTLIDYSFLDYTRVYEPLRARLAASGHSLAPIGQNSGPWYLRSIGPDQMDFRDESGGRGSYKENYLLEYDPTNGVFSLGEILKIQDDNS